jgi:hypothetical protein
MNAVKLPGHGEGSVLPAVRMPRQNCDAIHAGLASAARAAAAVSSWYPVAQRPQEPPWRLHAAKRWQPRCRGYG